MSTIDSKSSNRNDLPPTSTIPHNLYGINYNKLNKHLPLLLRVNTCKRAKYEDQEF